MSNGLQYSFRSVPLAGQQAAASRLVVATVIQARNSKSVEMSLDAANGVRATQDTSDMLAFELPTSAHR
jgi:hypothetical protein